ncbi:MAG: hypothetical protein C0478_06220 [Planctomyces sp.]|nr:hypothetical protein [Planctomyces sp.]
MARVHGLETSSTEAAQWMRHANPWSVWTRVPLLLVWIVVVWSRVWLGWWSLIPIALTLLWTIYNPRAFPVPKSTRSWASRAVLGERVWINRGQIPIPPHQQFAAQLLAGIAAVGLPFLVWGLVTLEVWPTALGAVIAIGAKLWFCDRMVWLYDEMSPRHPDYAQWLY